MISAFKQNHPIVWRTGFIVLPFVAGVAAYFAVAAAAPSYPHSIRTFLDENLQPLRELPVVVRLLGPNSSTAPETPIDTLMKHYAELKSEPVQAQIVRNALPEPPEIPAAEAVPDSGSVTWNTTNTGDIAPEPSLDMGNELDGPLYQLAESTDADTRIRAIEALSDASGRQAVRACVEGLMDVDPAVRRHASRALLNADREVLYREWVHVLQHGPSDLLQAFDTEIPNLQPQLESSALAGLASGDSNRIHKLAAIYTLGRIRSDAALPLLTGYAWSGDLELGQTATAAIAEIRSVRAVGALADLTEHYDADVRWYATNGLGLVKGEDALAALEAIIESGLEPVQEIRSLAIAHLAEARDPGSIMTLIDAITRYPGLRDDAMYALSQITGIEEFEVPYQWQEWYKEWSTTPEAQTVERRRRSIPAVPAAVLPVETAVAPVAAPTIETAPTAVTASAPEAPTAPEAPVETNPVEIPASDKPTEMAPAPETAPEPSPKAPVAIKKTGNGGGFGTSDLSPAELMRRGGFSKSKE